MHHLVQCTAITCKGARCQKFVKVTRDVDPSTVTCTTHGGYTSLRPIQETTSIPAGAKNLVTLVHSDGSGETLVTSVDGQLFMTKEEKKMEEFDIVIMVTGHRRIPNEEWLVQHLVERLKATMEAYPGKKILVVSGGADGADRLWARAAYMVGIPYRLVLPAGYYEHYHPGASWAKGIVDNAHSVEVVGDPTTPFDWKDNFRRNDRMIEMANKHVVISATPVKSLLQAPRGGTAGCVKSMKRKGIREVVRVDPMRKVSTREEV